MTVLFDGWVGPAEDDDGCPFTDWKVQRQARAQRQLSEAYTLASGVALDAQTRSGPTAPGVEFVGLGKHRRVDLDGPGVVIVWDPEANGGAGGTRRVVNPEGPGETWRVMNNKVRVKPGRAAAVLGCGSDPYVDGEGDVVCYVDAEGNPTTPVERVNHCGSRWCWACARRWAQRSMSVVAERLRALDDPMSRQHIVDTLRSDAEQLRENIAVKRADLSEQLQKATTTTDRLRIEREQRKTVGQLGTATRKERRAKTVERYASAEPRLLTLSQAPTVLPDDCSGAELQAALERDHARLSERLRKLTLSDEWRGKATAWAAKIEQTLSTPARRQEMANRGARHDAGRAQGTWWHVHVHCVVWGVYWPQAQLLDVWRETAEAPGVEAPDGGARIEVPKRWPKASSMPAAEMAKARADALREALKYATKPLDILYHHPSAAAAMIVALQGKRLLRLGGALEGLQLPDEDQPSESVDPVVVVDGPGPLFAEYDDKEIINEETGQVETVGILVEAKRAVWRTLSGRWIDPFDVNAAKPSTSPEAKEKARAWREAQWRAWKKGEDK